MSTFHVGLGFYKFLGRDAKGGDTITSHFNRRRTFATLDEARVEAERCNRLYPRIPKWEARTSEARQ
jgi:hypothetical protein